MATGGGDDRGGRRRDRGDRPDRAERSNDGDGGERRERYARDDRGERRDRGRDRFNGRPAEPQAPEQDEPRIAMDFLPPAIGVVEDAPAIEQAEEDAPKPRRRTRRPRVAEGDGEIAPAA